MQNIIMAVSKTEMKTIERKLIRIDLLALLDMLTLNKVSARLLE